MRYVFIDQTTAGGIGKAQFATNIVKLLAFYGSNVMSQFATTDS